MHLPWTVSVLPTILISENSALSPAPSTSRPTPPRRASVLRLPLDCGHLIAKPLILLWEGRFPCRRLPDEGSTHHTTAVFGVQIGQIALQEPPIHLLK